MQRCFAVVLFGVLLLISSGFATSRNRFETRRILARTPPPMSPNRRAQNANPHRGPNQVSGNAHPPLRRNLQPSIRPSVRR